MREHTEIVLLLDTSGSMGPLVPETTLAINSFIDQQKRLGANATFSMFTFSTMVLPFYPAMPIEMVQPISVIVTGGMTALLDAVATTIDETGKRLHAIDEKDRPSKVVFVVLTDGHENMSTRHTKDAVLARIAHQKTKYGWQFLFLGADADAFDDAAMMGIGYTQTMSWQPDEPGGIMRGLVAASNAISNYRSNNTSEAVYSSVDRVLNNFEVR